MSEGPAPGPAAVAEGALSLGAAARRGGSGQQPRSLASAPGPPVSRRRGQQEAAEQKRGLPRPRQLPAAGPLAARQLTHGRPTPRGALSRLRRCKSTLRGAAGRSSDSPGKWGAEEASPVWGDTAGGYTLVFQGGLGERSSPGSCRGLEAARVWKTGHP